MPSKHHKHWLEKDMDPLKSIFLLRRWQKLTSIPFFLNTKLLKASLTYPLLGSFYISSHEYLFHHAVWNTEMTPQISRVPFVK